MAWAFVASSAASVNGTGQTGTLAPGASAPLNSRIVVVATVGVGAGTEPGITVSDPTNGTYVEDNVAHIVDGAFKYRAGIYSINVSSAGAPTITVAGDQSGGSFAAQVLVYTGLHTSTTPVDVKVSALGTGGTASSGATGATTAANELVVAAYLDDGWSATLSGGGGTGFTVRGTPIDGASGGNGDVLVEDKDSGASGSTPTGALATNVPGASQSGATWAMLTTIYKLAAAAAYDPSASRFPDDYGITDAGQLMTQYRIGAY